MREINLIMANKCFLGCQNWCYTEKYDVVFLGVPSDLGTLGIRSTMYGPSTLRSASHILRHGSSASTISDGWFDYVSGSVILSGVKLSDAGDFPIDKRLGMQQFDVLPDVIESLSNTSRLIVVFGGDDSILYWLAKACSSRAMLLLDAHEDATSIDGEYPHHGNVVSYIEKMNQPSIILQYGLRGISPNQRKAPPANRIICSSLDDLMSSIKALEITELAINVDFDVFNPNIVDAVCARSPGGGSPDEMLALFEALHKENIRITFLSFTEFAPSQGSDSDTAFLLVQFVMRVLHIALKI